MNIDGAYQWVAKLKKVQPDVQLYFSIENGPHSFDHDMGLDEPCLRTALTFVNKFWPCSTLDDRL